MKKQIAVAALAAAMLFSLAAKAQAPQQDTFTLDPYYVETVIPGASYITWNLTSFDGSSASGSEVEYIATGTFTFAFPTLSLTCTSPSVTSTPLNPYGSTYQIQTTVATFACSDVNANAFGVVTTAQVLYKKVAGVRGRPNLTSIMKYPIQGVLTPAV